jgi:uncharacterized protein
MKKIINFPFLLTIKVYQLIIRPLFPSACRFYPSCSEYTYQSIQKYGIIKGIFLGGKRISSCHPKNPGGYDPVP